MSLHWCHILFFYFFLNYAEFKIGRYTFKMFLSPPLRKRFAIPHNIRLNINIVFANTAPRCYLYRFFTIIVLKFNIYLCSRRTRIPSPSNTHIDASYIMSPIKGWREFFGHGPWVIIDRTTQCGLGTASIIYYIIYIDIEHTYSYYYIIIGDGRCV